MNSEYWKLSLTITSFIIALVDTIFIICMSTIKECDEKLSYYIIILLCLRIITFTSAGIYFITLIINKFEIYIFLFGSITFICLILMIIGWIIVLALSDDPYPYGILGFDTTCEIINSICCLIEIFFFVVGILFSFFLFHFYGDTYEYAHIGQTNDGHAFDEEYSLQ